MERSLTASRYRGACLVTLRWRTLETGAYRERDAPFMLRAECGAVREIGAGFMVTREIRIVATARQAVAD